MAIKEGEEGSERGSGWDGSEGSRPNILEGDGEMSKPGIVLDGSVDEEINGEEEEDEYEDEEDECTSGDELFAADIAEGKESGSLRKLVGAKEEVTEEVACGRDCLN